MTTIVRAEAVITAKSQLRPGLREAARDLQNFAQQQSKAQSLIASGVSRMAMAAGGAIAGVAGLGALKEATKRFAEVDRAMTRTGITGDATAEETRKGAAELRNLARDTATLFDPAQKGLDAITASGRDFGDAMKMMPDVLKTAQASGAGVDDIANSSISMIDHMKISIEGLAEAQDTLAMGGKLGKFELKDMARYLPSMLPAYKAIGKSGQEGLRNLVAMLQVIRGGTGTAEEAAASAQNIFSKMESDQTVKNFKEMGVDLPKAMTKARKEGKDLLDVFLELSNKALKGDLSKIPQLFQDMEVQRGMRPLLADMQKILELREKLKSAKGTIDIDFQRVSPDAQASLDRLKEAADRAKTAIGALATEAGSPYFKAAAGNIDAVAQAMERAAEAARKGGFTGAVKSLADDVGGSVVKDLREHSDNFAKLEDDATLGTGPNQGGMLDWMIGDTSRAATQKALDDLKAKEKRGALSYFDKVNKRNFQNKLAEFDDAWSRDQMRRVGAMPEQLTNASPEFANEIESAREARRAAGFPKQQAPLSGGRKGNVLPPTRPSGLGLALPPVQGLDDVKSKVEAAASSFDLLGPAAKSAGGQIETGFTAARGQVQALLADVTALQTKLNNLRAPSLSFGGAGGLPTGKSMGEVR
ncbi:phage tail tape measure protein [Bosea sp. LjRoot9]|uniref:phage tail tape measure protein n=1 Tax=Bosea sp. LjRoot9 TaxID=3342341 RepID=UPI003ECC600E